MSECYCTACLALQNKNGNRIWIILLNDLSCCHNTYAVCFSFFSYSINFVVVFGRIIVVVVHISCVFGLITLQGMIWRQNRKCISIFFLSFDFRYIWNYPNPIRNRKYRTGYIYILISKYSKIQNTRSDTERVSERPPLPHGHAGQALVSYWKKNYIKNLTFTCY